MKTGIIVFAGASFKYGPYGIHSISPRNSIVKKRDSINNGINNHYQHIQHTTNGSHSPRNNTKHAHHHTKHNYHRPFGANHYRNYNIYNYFDFKKRE